MGGGLHFRLDDAHRFRASEKMASEVCSAGDMFGVSQTLFPEKNSFTVSQVDLNSLTVTVRKTTFLAQSK